MLEDFIDKDAEIGTCFVSVVDVECEGDSLVGESGIVTRVDGCFGTSRFTT